MYYINLFYINSIIGYILESIFYFLFNWEGNSGILFGPWTPVYGIGSILIIILFKLVNKLNISKIIKYIIFFFVIATALSIIEIIGGNLIEMIFHETFWNYKNHAFNIGKYASLEMSILWGFASIIYIILLKNIIDKIVNRIPKFITYIITILLIFDICATIILKI